MAGYGINQQGVENLQKLASDLHHFNDNFEEAGRALRQGQRHGPGSRQW